MRSRLSIAAFVLGAALGGLAPLARAQEKPCMADAARLCPNVEPGGGAQIACLKEHKQELSPECKKHVMQAKLKHEEQKQYQQQQERAPNP
jgi:Cysteine rich repeat